MTEDEKRVGDFLRKFGPRPAPPELKRRVLAAAGVARGQDAFFSRAQGRAAAAFGFLLLAAIVGDALFAGLSTSGLRDLTAEPASAGIAREMIVRDLIREISDKDRSLEEQIMNHMAAGKTSKRIPQPAFGGGGGDVREVDDVY